MEHAGPAYFSVAALEGPKLGVQTKRFATGWFAEAEVAQPNHPPCLASSTSETLLVDTAGRVAADAYTITRSSGDFVGEGATVARKGYKSASWLCRCQCGSAPIFARGRSSRSIKTIREGRVAIAPGISRGRHGVRPRATVVLYGREASQWLMPGARGEPGQYHQRNDDPQYMWGWRESTAQGRDVCRCVGV